MRKTYFLFTTFLSVLTATSPGRAENESSLVLPEQVIEEAQATSAPKDAVRPTESQYFFIPSAGQNSVRLGFGSAAETGARIHHDRYNANSNTMIDKNAQIQTTSFEWSRGVGKNYFTRLGLAYETRSWERLTDQYDSVRMSRKGLKDLQFTFGRAAQADRYNLVYGTDLAWSPRPAIVPTDTSDGNSFSGGTSLSPFFGFEKPSAKGTWGAQLELEFVLDRRTVEFDRISKTQYDNYSAFEYGPISISSFYEFSLTSIWELGVSVNLANRPSPDGYFTSSGESEAIITDYGASAYSAIHVNAVTNILVSAQAQTVDSNVVNSRSSSTTTQFNLGLRRLL